MTGCKIGRVKLKNLTNVTPIGNNTSSIDDPAAWPLMAALECGYSKVVIIGKDSEGKLSFNSNTADRAVRNEMIDFAKFFLFS